MICFQNVSLTYWYSLETKNLKKVGELWFAFKMYLWLIDIHFQSLSMCNHFRCDLLSKCIFDLLIFTTNRIKSNVTIVVICFQNVSLTYWYSLAHRKNKVNRCCDLLSKCIFDLLIFTRTAFGSNLRPVVICFQNVSLTYWYSLTAVYFALAF